MTQPEKSRLRVLRLLEKKNISDKDRLAVLTYVLEQLRKLQQDSLVIPMDND